jgi:putative Ca2+/H+ antiporter (TMEM165/GDT1 family)
MDMRYVQLSLKKGAGTASDDDDDDDDEGSSSPVSSSGHKEYQSQTDTLADPPAAAQPHLSPQDDDDGAAGGISQPLHSFTLSFVMIIFSEIGDKTFLIAALMAMKHPRLLVFSAALGSLIVMSILSALLGHAVPTLLPKNFTNFLAAGLFLVFGVRMVLEGLKMEKGTANVQEEMKEVEQELEEKATHSSASARSLEGGLIASPRGSNTHALRRSTSSPSLSDSDEDDYARARGRGKAQNTRVTSLEGIQNLAGLLLSPAWVQTFVMTFLGEWGDRSQIATIAMAAGQDYWYVTIGAISGHAICTGIAVIGGRMLASRISVRNGRFSLSVVCGVG